jgi:DNA-binding NtrC family response regulator
VRAHDSQGVKAASHPSLPQLVGRSRPFLDLLAHLRQFAAVDAPVLIEGETGTGKELVARAMHYIGPRADCPFIPVNCGAIPDGLIESELFGHMRGAFTDAHAHHAGLVAQANTGTMFLDEVDGLTSKGQVTLLRFLEDMRYRPLGARREERANLRIIAATNADLPALVEQRQMRADLLFRLKILTLRVPALRDRAGDAGLLAEHFVRCYSARYGRAIKPIAPETMDALEGHHWPGNVRELESMVHRAFLLSEGPLVHIEELERARPLRSPQDHEPAPELCFTRAKAHAIASFERTFLARTLARTSGNVTLAAQLCGKERRSFGKLLKKHGIDRDVYARAR